MIMLANIFFAMLFFGMGLVCGEEGTQKKPWEDKDE